MSRKGNCWDNAPTERFFNNFKNEQVHGTSCETRADAVADAFHYIEPFSTIAGAGIPRWAMSRRSSS